MSGIAGIFYRDGKPAERSHISSLVRSLARRGSDAEGIWIDAQIGLGHAMLWTTPESLHEKLPLVDTACSLCITSDARIDNRSELIAKVGLAGCQPNEITDSELILRSYEKWADHCCEHLVGDFAFAIWDERKQLLFCARDHFGVKPLYYHCSDAVFVFASEIKALLSVGVVPRRINECRIADYLVTQLEGIDHSSTFYEEILRLPPARALRVTRQTLSQQCYWSPDSGVELRHASNKEYADAFLEVFTEAVDCRLRSAYPVASMLSGGLDSSSIVGVAKELLNENGKRLHTLAAISKTPGCVETGFINMVLGRNEIESHTVSPDQLEGFADGFDYLIKTSHDLFDHQMALPQSIYLKAREQNLRIVLDGVDGDLVASLGLIYLAYLMRAGKLKTAISEAFGTSRYHCGRVSPWTLLYGNAVCLAKPIVPQPVLKLRRFLLARENLVQITNGALISPDFARRIHLSDRLKDLNNGRPILFRTLREEQAHVLSSASSYITAALERYDRAAAAHSIEPRHPFFDKRLVEFCLALPWDQRVSEGWSKMILRRAMAGILPDAVRWRRGWEHLGSEFASSVMVLNNKLIEDLMNGQGANVRRYVDEAKLHNAFKSYTSYGSIEDGMLVWEVATLSAWLSREQRL
ncbi:MAG: asparagine synthase (glutamine-hydrolyzing) [Pyrinomonadaceae bacterium]